ncbi:MAG: FmdB family zinc ribbon protein [Phycisphaerales bacterium]
MPTYEYQCASCEHRFEQYQSIKDAPLRRCPECGKVALERLIGTGAAVLFKGSGFYQTDYRSESYKKAAEADKPSAVTDKTSDSKPAAAVVDKPAKAPRPPAKSEPNPKNPKA